MRWVERDSLKTGKIRGVIFSIPFLYILGHNLRALLDRLFLCEDYRESLSGYYPGFWTGSVMKRHRDPGDAQAGVKIFFADTQHYTVLVVRKLLLETQETTLNDKHDRSSISFNGHQITSSAQRQRAQRTS